MKYKIQELMVDDHGNVDIPEGWIPLGYKETIVAKFGGGNYIMKELIVLEPI